MDKIVVSSVFACVATSCGPDVDDDDGDPPGALEFEMPVAKFYRLDRRVEMVGRDPAVDPSGCGLLTDRAHDEIIRTLDELDPSAEYDFPECDYDPEGSVHIEGFVHSPLACSWYCCHLDLLPIALAYFAAGSNLDGQYPSIDGEPYVALEPDVPCPD